MPYTYEYPRPALTVDCVLFGLEGDQLKTLLIARAADPFAGSWALPGGFVEMDEGLEAAALRELEEETGVTNVFVEQVYTFGAPERDPRSRVVSVAHYALVNVRAHPVRAGSDASSAGWFCLHQLPPLAFDHELVIRAALQRLQAKVRYEPIGLELLPEKFSFSQLETLYETILSIEIQEEGFVLRLVRLNKRNFRSKMKKLGIVNELEKQMDVAHRGEVLYQFDKEKYDELSKSGFKDNTFITEIGEAR